MADIRGNINSSSDSETCIDEIKAEDYNFYVLNNILSQNIILQNYLNEEGTVNALQESFMNFSAPSDPCETLSDSKQVKIDVSLTSTVPPNLEDKCAKNEYHFQGKNTKNRIIQSQFQKQTPRVSLKDTFLEDVLSTSTKSFIERVSKNKANKKPLKKTSHCACNDDGSVDSSGSPSRAACSPAISVDTDLKSSSSTTTLALDESYTNSSPSNVTHGPRSHSEEEKKQAVNLNSTNEPRTVPQKRKEKNNSNDTPYNAQKKVKMFATCSSPSPKNISKSDQDQELNCTADTHATTIRDEGKSVDSISMHQTEVDNQQSGEKLRENMPDEVQTLKATNSTSSNYTVKSDTPSDDFEWSIENLQLFGLALPEDSDMDTLTDKTENSDVCFSYLDACPYGCRDLMSSEHLYHLHLAAQQLNQKETHTSESFAEPAKCKNDLLCHLKNKILLESKRNRSHGCQQNESIQKKNIKINSVAIVNKPTDVVVDNTDSKDDLSKTVLNGVRREKILKGNIKLCDKVTCQFCEKSEHNTLGKPPVPVHCVRNPDNKSGEPQSTSCSNITLSGTTSITQGLNNNMAAHTTAVSNNSYNITPASASSHFYKPSGIYGFGNMTNENYIHLEPFTVPNGSMWFGKQAQPVNSPFSTTNVSPHVMNSPWYQQWFHAMNMRRPLASQVPSTPCNYFEPLKMNHYSKTMWGTPNVAQHRIFQRPSSTIGSLPRMFQPPFLHSCFPATISCGDHHTGTHVQYTGQQAEIAVTSHSPVSVEANQETNCDELGKS